MVAIGEAELQLLKRIRVELGGTLAPTDGPETSMAIKLAAAGYLDDGPEQTFVLSALAEEYLQILLD